MTTGIPYDGSPVFQGGQIIYNGILLNLTTQHRAKVTPVYSDSDRMVKYLNYVFTVEAVIVADACNPSDSPGNYPPGSYRAFHQETTGAILAEMREQLLEEGGELYLKEVGLGYDLHVVPARKDLHGVSTHTSLNLQKGGTTSMGSPASMTRMDVKHGPKPRELAWEPLSSRAARIVWSVEFNLARCYDEEGQIVATDALVNWSLNEAGLTTRTVNGYYEVAVNQQVYGGDDNNEKKSTNDADRFRYWIRLDWAPLAGFHRTQTYSLSEDRSRLTYTLVDTEIDTGQNAYYPGVINADVVKTTQNQGALDWGKSDTQWSMTLSGSIEVRPGLSPKVAWAAFITIVREQLSYFRDGTKKDEGGIANEQRKEFQTKGDFMILTGVTISEPLFGRSMSFTLSWMFTTKLEHLIEATGHFRPLDTRKKEKLPGATEPEKIHNWDLHSKSLAKVQGERGIANMRLHYTEDHQVGVCNFRESPVLRYFERPPTELPNSEPILESRKPDPETSYRDYQSQAGYDEDTGTVIQKTLRTPTEEPKEFQGSRADFRKAITLEIAGKQYAGGINEPTVISHRRGDSVFRVTLVGYAIRAGYIANIPTLQSWNGIPVKLLTRKITDRTIGTAGGGLHLTQWRLVYALEDALTGDLNKAGALEGGPKLLGQGMAEGLL